MKGHNVGYIRVSSTGQNTDRQLIDVQLDMTFTDKASGKDQHRPELKRCMDHLRIGDVLHVHSIDRLARNLKDLQDIVEALVSKGVTVKFYKEGLTFNAEDSGPMQKLMLQMLGAFAEFERTLIRERQREGIEAAKQAGKQLGAKPKLNAAQVTEVKLKVSQGADKSQLAKEYGISRPTLYKIISA